MRDTELEEYERRIKYYMEAGVDHYVIKLGQNVGPKTIDTIKRFQERTDIDCMIL